MYEFNREDAFRFSNHIGIPAKQKGNNLIFVKCPYCGNNTNSKEKFAISLETGQFNCFRASCGARGNMITLARDFDFRISEEVDRYYNRNNYNGKFKRFADAHRITESTDAAIEYMKSRGISETVCRRYEITTKNSNLVVFPFKNEVGELKFIKYRDINFKKGKKGSKEWCEADCMPILFGMAQCEDYSRLVITEGQIDSLSVAEAGIKNAVSVPTGCNGSTWVPHCWDWVNRFDEIVIFGDKEGEKITLVEMIQSRFAKKRIRIVRLNDYLDCKDANEILQKHGVNAIKIAIDNAETVLNKRVKNAADIVAVDLDKIPKIKTGFAQLDKTLKGGFMHGQVILLTGRRGMGKSTLGSQFIAEALAQKVNCFIYSGELPDFFVKAWLDGQLVGSQKLTNSQIDKCNQFYDDRLFIYNNQLVETDEFDDLLTVVEDTIIKKDIRLVLLDNLMTALEAHDNESLYRKQSEFVGKLAKLSKALEIVIILVAHPRKSKLEFENDDVSGSADITNRVDVVMSYDNPPDDKHQHEDNERVLKVTKNRLTGRLGSIPLYFSEDSKRISEVQNDFVRSYFDEFVPVKDEFLEIPF